MSRQIDEKAKAMFVTFILDNLSNSSSVAALKDIIENTSMEWTKIYKILIDYLPENYEDTIPADEIGKYLLEVDYDHDVSDFDMWFEEARPLNGMYDDRYNKNSLNLVDVASVLSTYYYEIEAMDEWHDCEVYAKEMARDIFKKYSDNF